MSELASGATRRADSEPLAKKQQSGQRALGGRQPWVTQRRGRLHWSGYFATKDHFRPLPVGTSDWAKTSKPSIQAMLMPAVSTSPRMK